MSVFSPTPQQSAAINARGGALLISAGAGSGKTRVLVERLLSRICDGRDPCELSQFLIITFTRAAAAELRERILLAINERIAADPSNSRLRRQARLAASAEIGTIHSFCSRIVRENAAKLQIAPNARTAEESETAALRGEVMSSLLEKLYAECGDEVDALLDGVSVSRGDDALAALILRAYDALYSNGDPREFAAEILAGCAPADGADAGKTVWGAYVLETSLATVRGFAAYARAAENADAVSGFPQYGGFINSLADAFEVIAAAFVRGWDAARGALGAGLPQLKDVKPRAKGGAPDFVKAVQAAAKDLLETLRGRFHCSSDELREDSAATAPTLGSLIRFTLRFADEFGAEKRRRGILDFNDLEQLLLRLLRDEPNLADELSARYKEVMVDEFQDVSEVQDAIIRAASGNGAKLVMVGDARQSIYGFRNAAPEIFTGKYDALTRGASDGIAVVLADNFRSRGTVLNAVNLLFSRIMSRRVGGLDYTAREYLTPGRQDADGGEPPEYALLDAAATGDDAEDEDTGAELEARYIAGRILKLTDGGFRVPDGAGTRPAVFADIAVILRSMKGRGDVFRAVFAEYGIPLGGEPRGGFTEEKETELALAFLRAIDNPTLDVPLAAVMSSQAFGFTPDELAEIKPAGSGMSLWSAVRARPASDAKTAAFGGAMSALCELAPVLGVSGTLARVYDKLGLLSDVCGWERGETRRRNLIFLSELAAGFESSGGTGLRAFVRYCENVKTAGDAAAETSGVKLMTIHKAKGLEFPVVFLPGLGKRLNLTDASERVLFHPKLGAGLPRVDRALRIAFGTLPKSAIALRLREEALSEELRLLYVAMTRAREKLIMTSVLSGARSKAEKLAPFAGNPVPAFALSGRSDVASCIMLALLGTPDGAPLLGGACDTPETFAVSLISRNEAGVTPRAARTDAPGEAYALPPEPEPLGYAFADSVNLPSKLTYSELRGRLRAAEVTDDAELRAAPVRTARRVPRFAENAAVSGAERGTAIHEAFRLIDYSRCTDRGGVFAELERLGASGLPGFALISEDDRAKIAAFFECETGKAAIRAYGGGKLLREFKFSLLRPARELFDTAAADEILFQGVVDLAFFGDGGLTIADFKSDRIRSDAQLGEKTEYYSLQIREYAYAMRRITKLPVARAGLFFLDAGAWREVAV
ncbi:MAG: UvrD-helicase domain-containing protein [Oscillospiraceae bacterium]|jgi:ATP-dependent helicase/nuclease subunit A|nr:UvrD-helicase domain-containing protein [Oscillospiraceae bacterium]